MATRTSSPPGSRSKSTSSKGTKSSSGSRSRSGSSSRSRSTTKRSRTSARKRRPAPRAVRSGRGPVARLFLACGRGLAALWLGIAHAVGAVARRIGKTARDLEPEHRRDGVGLFLFALAVVVAAAVWWEIPGALMNGARTMVNGSVGKVGWLVPLILVWVGWRNMRDPEHNGPAGRQVVGWVALVLRGPRRRPHRRRQPPPGQRRHLRPQRRRGSGRLRRVEPAARPAPHALRRRAAAPAPGRVRRPGDHRDPALPGAGQGQGAARPDARSHPRRRRVRPAGERRAQPPPWPARRRPRPRAG